MSTHLKETKEEQKNLFIAMVLIVAVLFGFDFIFPSNNKDKIAVSVQPKETKTAEVLDQNTYPKEVEKDEHLTVQTAVLPLENDLLSGTLSVSDGGIDALQLTAYKQTTEKDSPNVQLLSPNEYWTALGWNSSDVKMPMMTDTWQADNTKLTPFSPITFSYENDDVVISRVISMDEAYLFSVTDTIKNKQQKPVSVSLTGEVNRRMNPDKLTASVVHEGFLSLIDGTLTEKDYTDVEDDKFEETTKGGWVGITDKYWQTVMIFDQSIDNVAVGFKQKNGLYTASFRTPSEVIPAGGNLTRTTRLFAGAKKLDLINMYEKDFNIPKFDLSIDFGWFYFLTRPFLAFLNWLYAIVGNMGVAILIFATLLRIVMLPVATKSYESMAKMRKVQPRMKLLQERYKNDRMRLQQEMMNLYKREKINPAGGCLPMLIQIPVFYALYKVLSVSINMRQAPFFGWIHDLSMPDPSSVFTAFGYLDWPIPSILNIGVWPVLMGLTMYIQQKLNPAPTDKTQANMFKWMPVIFTFMLGNFAAGLVIYWTWSNVLSIAQQKYIMKKVGV